MKIYKDIFITSVAFFSPFLHAQNLQCPDIARTLKTYQIESSSSAFLNSVFSQHCQQDGSKKSSGSAIGLDTIIKAIPIKFTGNYSNSAEGFSNFCKTYATLTTATNAQDAYKEYISDKALTTIDQCLRLQASGVQISHDLINKESLSFYLRSSVTQNFSIQGITTTGNITCSGQINGKPANFDRNTSVFVKATQNFQCLRNPEKSLDGRKLFNEATVTVATNQGPYSVLLPRDERFPENMASTIAAQIEMLRAELATSTAMLRTVTDAKPIPIYQCPVGWVKGGPPGQWASYGCQGQISASPTCIDNVYPAQQILTCSPLGSVRPY